VSPAVEFAAAAKEATAARAKAETGATWPRPRSGGDATEPPPLPNAVEQEAGA
jgi:hypothetical protein